MRIVATEDGIVVELGRKTLGLDHRGTRLLSYYFVSHAHSDHLSRDLINKDVICSSPTSIFASMRGIPMNQITSPQFKLIANGHILGSSALLLGDQLLYTGDFNDRERPFSSRFRPPRTKVLIMEATYGRPFFRFPEESEIISEAKDKVLELLNRGKNVIILGYALGKSQHLQLFFDRWFGAFKNYVWPLISRYNDIYRLFGEKISDKTEVFPPTVPEMMDGKGWLLYMPSYASRISLYDELRRKGAFSISFTGWATYRNYADSVNVDLAFPLSDHADFDGLIRIAEEVDPEVVLVTHGFASDFSLTLRRMGMATASERSEISNLSKYLT